jgi:hypothetical protein
MMIGRKDESQGKRMRKGEAEDLGWEESETGYRAVYITDGSARQSWFTTYPSVKKRVVSQNLRSCSVVPEESKIKINIII